MYRYFMGAGLLALGSLLTTASIATAVTLRVSVNNLAPNQGTFTTPVWFGIHDGRFDLFDVGNRASSELERLAEDGTIAPLADAFDSVGVAQGTVFGPTMPPIGPGETGSTTVTFDVTPGRGLYFSYAAMILPSNDAFIGNENPFQVQLFDNSGTFTGADFIVPGIAVWDAGTEVNDEALNSTAFLGQTVPDTGTAEGGTVQRHPGFTPGGRILSSPDFANADFTASGYNVARITIEQVPEPWAIEWMLALVGLLPITIRWRRRQGHTQ